VTAVAQAAHFKFRLFVAGGTPNSAEALGNLTVLCEACLPGQHEIEVVDVFREPARALAEGIFMTPTLLRLEPSPVTKVVGTLSNTEVAYRALGLPAAVA
jgi:circadian clock protein KaiB